MTKKMYCFFCEEYTTEDVCSCGKPTIEEIEVTELQVTQEEFDRWPELVACPTCKGVGSDAYTNNDCPDCAGRGFQPEMKE